MRTTVTIDDEVFETTWELVDPAIGAADFIRKATKHLRLRALSASLQAAILDAPRRHDDVS